MKIASYNSSSISIVTGKENHSGLRLSETFGNSSIADNSLSRSEKRKAKGTVKSVMAMVYFVSLVFFLFVLLT
jgi:hypothetical protein